MDTISLQYFLAYSENGIQIFQNNVVKTVMDLDKFDYSFLGDGLYISNHEGLQLLIPKIREWSIKDSSNNHIEISRQHNSIFIKRKT